MRIVRGLAYWERGLIGVDLGDQSLRSKRIWDVGLQAQGARLSDCLLLSQIEVLRSCHWSFGNRGYL